MNFFKKIFGPTEPEVQPIEIPKEASPHEVIRIAISSVVQNVGGNCATITTVDNSGSWIQIMDSVLNCSYPHLEHPESLFPELFGNKVISGFDGYEPELYVTLALHHMEHSQLASWIERYFEEVLSVEMNSSDFSIEMEDL